MVPLDEPDNDKLCDDVFLGIINRAAEPFRIRSVSIPHQTVISAMNAWGIIDNGGFPNLFEHKFEGDPNFRIMRRSLERIGYQQGVRAFEQALALFPGGKLSRSRDRRMKQYAAAPKERRDAIDHLWFDTSTLIPEKLAAYIRENRHEFNMLPKSRLNR